nr:gas vesicle protein GvpD [Candidatus Freyrarchaeum guaymaensis]
MLLLRKAEEGFIDARAPQVLPGRGGEWLPLKYSSAPEFVEVLYVRLRRGREPRVAVVDSLDALKFNLKIPPEDFQVEKLLLEMAEATGSSMVLVSEGMRESRLEYIVDCVATLGRKLVDGFLVREIVVEKVRGKRIGFPSRLFTLRNGRFTVLEPKQHVMPEVAEPPPVKEVRGDVIPTTIDELDRVLGGVRRGQVVALEVGEDVGVDYRWLTVPLFLNAVRQDYTVFIIPSGGYSWINVKKSFQPFEERVQSVRTHVHTIQFAERKGEEAGNVHVVKGEDPDKDLEGIKEVISTRAGVRGSVDFIATDILEYVYGGEEMLNIVSRLVIALRRLQHSVILVMKHGQSGVSNFLHMADVHFKMENVNGVTIVQGKNPSTMLYALTVDDSEEYIKTKLIPVE